MPRKETIKKRAPAGMCNPRPKTRKANGKEYHGWEAKCTVGYDPQTGKQKQVSIWGATKKEVLEKFKKIQSEVDTGTYIEPCKMTLSEWLDTYITDYCTNIKPRTLDSYMTNCSVHIKPVLGNKKLSKLTSLDIQRFYNGLKNAKTGEPLSPKTIKNIHGTLHKALERARKNGYIPINPADSDYVELPRIQPTEIQPFEDSEVTMLIEELSESNYKNLYLLMLFGGLREGEALGLPIDAIDWENGAIRIKQQLQKNRRTKQFEIISPKSNKARTVYVSDYVLDLLRDQLKRQEAMKKQACSAWSNPWGLVFTKEDGSCISPQTIYCNFKRRAKAIGCGDKRVHDLRHSFAVASLRSGDDIKTVQGNLGHHTAAFTLQTYAHITDSMRRDSAARMSNYIEKVLPKPSAKAT